MKSFTKIMKALSDPNRVIALKLLQKQERCVCEIRAGLGLAQPTVSRHLKVLEEAGLVEGRKKGQWVHYRLTKGEDSTYAQAMLENLKQWLSKDKALLEADKRMREFACSNPGGLPPLKKQ